MLRAKPQQGCLKVEPHAPRRPLGVLLFLVPDSVFKLTVIRHITFSIGMARIWPRLGSAPTGTNITSACRPCAAAYIAARG